MLVHCTYTDIFVSTVHADKHLKKKVKNSIGGDEKQKSKIHSFIDYAYLCMFM